MWLALSLALFATGYMPPVAQRGSGLDCALGPVALVNQLTATKAQPRPVRADQTFAVYADEETRSLYTLTMPQHPAHPTIVKRAVVAEAGSVSISTSACGYGDKAAFDRLMVEFDELTRKATPRR